MKHNGMISDEEGSAFDLRKYGSGSSNAITLFTTLSPESSGYSLF